jgi:predicted nucleic acid-binding protein
MGLAAAVPGRVFVDSGPWIALASVRDSRHGDADRLFRAALVRRLPLVTTNLVVAEVHRLLLFRAGGAVARAFLERLDRSPSLQIAFTTEVHHRRAREWLDKLEDQTITYADAVSFAVLEATRCTAVLTFDDDFTVAGFARFAG